MEDAEEGAPPVAIASGEDDDARAGLEAEPTQELGPEAGLVRHLDEPVALDDFDRIDVRERIPSVLDPAANDLHGGVHRRRHICDFFLAQLHRAAEPHPSRRIGSLADSFPR